MLVNLEDRAGLYNRGMDPEGLRLHWRSILVPDDRRSNFLQKLLRAVDDDLGRASSSLELDLAGGIVPVATLAATATD